MTKWSEDTTLKFVKLYKESECLWNSNLIQYRNKKSRQIAIDRIVKQMNLPNFGSEEVKTKIRIMRSTYCQEIAKIEKSWNSGVPPDQVYRPSVKWFPIMNSIIKGFMQGKRSTKQNVDPDGTSYNEKSQNEFSYSDCDESQPGLGNDASNILWMEESAEEEELLAPTNKKIKVTEDNEISVDALDEIAFDISSLQSTSGLHRKQEEEECHAFGKLVAQKMLKYSSSMQTSVQQSIMSILFNADRDHCTKKRRLQENLTTYHRHPENPLPNGSLESRSSSPFNPLAISNHSNIMKFED